jgi:hypothetical protein
MLGLSEQLADYRQNDITLSLQIGSAARLGLGRALRQAGGDAVEPLARPGGGSAAMAGGRFFACPVSDSFVSIEAKTVIGQSRQAQGKVPRRETGAYLRPTERQTVVLDRGQRLTVPFTQVPHEGDRGGSCPIPHRAYGSHLARLQVGPEVVGRGLAQPQTGQVGPHWLATQRRFRSQFGMGTAAGLCYAEHFGCPWLRLGPQYPIYSYRSLSLR